MTLSTYMEIHNHGNTTITQNMVLLTYSTSYTVIHYTIKKWNESCSKFSKIFFFCCDYWYEIVQAFFMFNKYFHNSKSEYYHAHVAYQFIPILICCFFCFCKIYVCVVAIDTITMNGNEAKNLFFLSFGGN